MDKIDELFSRIDSLPPAPGILPRLLAVLANPETDLNEVTDLIAVDPALTAKLLQTCNSAYFGRATPVDDVTAAINQLGFQTVYRIVAVVSGMRCLRPSAVGALDLSRLWKHLVTTAFAAQFIGEDIRADGGMLFTAGLLHDMGKMLLAKVFKADYVCLLSGRNAQGQAIVDLERMIYNMDHAQVGARLLQRWNFSPQLVACVQFHHQPTQAGIEQTSAACIQLADWLAHSVDTDPTQSESPAESPEAPLALCGLRSEDLVRYSDRIRENVAFVEAMCRLSN